MNFLSTSILLVVVVCIMLMLIAGIALFARMPFEPSEMELDAELEKREMEDWHKPNELTEQEVFFTAHELDVLARLFDVVGEDTLRAHYFTKSDISQAYDILDKVRDAQFELTCAIEDAKAVA